MKKFRVLAAALLAAFLVGAVPASAAFDQSVLDGIVLISSGAPDSTGEMSYWRGHRLLCGPAGRRPPVHRHQLPRSGGIHPGRQGLGGGELAVFFDEDTEEEAYLVDYDYEKDVALLKLAEPTDQRVALSMREAPESALGNEVYAVGYPLAADLTVTVRHLRQQERRHRHHRQHQPLSDGERHRPQADPDRRGPQRRQLRRSPDGRGRCRHRHQHRRVGSGPEPFLCRLRQRDPAPAGPQQHSLHHRRERFRQ